MVADFNKKRNSNFFNKQLFFKTAGIVFLVIIVVMLVADLKIYQKKQKLVSRINAYQKQIEDIKKSSQTLKDEIANADNKDYLEKLGYEQFNQTRPGETEYMFIKSPPKTDSVKTESAAEQQNFLELLTGWLSGALGWIKNNF